MNKIANPTSLRLALVTILKVNGQNCHNLNDIANVFNTFFTTVAAKLVDKMPPSHIYFMLPLLISNSLTVDSPVICFPFIYILLLMTLDI